MSEAIEIAWIILEQFRLSFQLNSTTASTSWAFSHPPPVIGEEAPLCEDKKQPLLDSYFVLWLPALTPVAQLWMLFRINRMLWPRMRFSSPGLTCYSAVSSEAETFKLDLDPQHSPSWITLWGVKVGIANSYVKWNSGGKAETNFNSFRTGQQRVS